MSPRSDPGLNPHPDLNLILSLGLNPHPDLNLDLPPQRTSPSSFLEARSPLPNPGGETRSSKTATAISPRTLDVVRHRSSSQSTVKRMGILSTGSRTAAKIKGMVTKLPDGIPPAPTLAI